MRQGRRSHCRGKSSIDLVLDVLHNQVLVGVIEEVVKTSLVKFPCLVGGADLVVKVLAAAGPRVLVESAVKNQDRQRN